ncbi:MAG TPA: carboxylesterase family protein [Longimicrobiaceae bacterium]|nr:carboxylesterase family protein [Longimicrobiaceae bacterium]
MTLSVAALLLAAILPGCASTPDPLVRTASGPIQGTIDSTGVRMYKGIPYAAPPVGDLRWREPQPVKSWTATRQATAFGPRCMQRPVFSDMVFRSNGMSEDCLYLNVWTPADAVGKKLPVLVYFFGGGFIAGDGSEPRYDGASMARKGIVAVTVNYRLGAFGFLAHPELTAESPHHASGDYGLLDQAAALQWVKQNIAAFGGDPDHVTIGGESAGSISVSAQMASPLSRGLIAGAIGESGALMGPTLPAVPLAAAESLGVKFATALGAKSLAELRAIPADSVLAATAKPELGRFPVAIDGYFLTEPTVETFAAGRQAQVPLLVGWNSQEGSWEGLLRGADPTPANYEAAVRRIYGDAADAILRVYPGSSPEQVKASGTALASDQFIAFSTWKWAELQGKTGGHPVYRYYYAHPRPPMRNPPADAPPPAEGAVHSAEIEYALGNLDTNHVFAWTPADHRVSQVVQAYFANFIKTGNPNGSGLPEWPAANSGDTVEVMRLDVQSGARPDWTHAQHVVLDSLLTARQAQR